MTTKKELVELVSMPLKQRIHERGGAVTKTEIVPCEMHDGIVVRVVGSICEQVIIPAKRWAEATE